MAKKVVSLERKKFSLLRALVDLRDRQIQKGRIQFGNRLKAIERMDDPASEEQKTTLERYFAQLAQMEKQLDRDVMSLVGAYPIYRELSQLRGVGPQLAAKLIALIDIEQADTVSSLWRFAGLAVIDGKAEKPHKGEKLHFSRRLRTAVHLVGSSFLMLNSPYRRIYAEARDKYASERDEWPPIRQHLAAMRKMEKLFLAHLWLRWRTLEGLPVSKPYIEVLAHEDANGDFVIPPHRIYAPEEFGWPAVTEEQSA
jgi:hypothetical protein